MTGQMSMEDFLPREKPVLHEPGVYSRSGNQYLKAERHGKQIEVSICTYNEMMIIRVDATELKEYMEQLWKLD